MTFSRMLSVFVAVLAVPLVVSAASPLTFKELVGSAVSIMNSAIGILVSAALVLYFFGVLKHMRKSGESDNTQMRDFVLLGVVVLFVMVSIWGILEVLQNTLEGGAPTTSSPAPTNTDVFGTINI